MGDNDIKETTSPTQPAVEAPAAPRPVPPTVGRIVHYRTPLESKGGQSKGQPYSAVITHVWSEYVVNLRVHNDGTHRLRDDELLPTSVIMGEGPGEWSWPPRN